MSEYKTFQVTDGAMAWRISTLKVSGMSQLGMLWRGEYGCVGCGFAEGDDDE